MTQQKNINCKTKRSQKKGAPGWPGENWGMGRCMGLIHCKSFNTSKTEELLISKACNMRVHPDFAFKEEAIMWVDTLHLLGVNFSLDLSWTEHLGKIRSSCSKKLRVILRWKSLLPDESFLPFFIFCIRLSQNMHVLSSLVHLRATPLSFKTFQIKQFVQQPLTARKLKPNSWFRNAST